MRKFILPVTILAAIISGGCAKQVSDGPNDANKRYFDAWMQINHPGAEPTGLGIYILEDEPGDGAEIEGDGFVFTDYVISDLDGNISSFTSKTTAKQMGTYDTTTYYGPKAQTTAKGGIMAGLAEGLSGMKVGGRRKFIIPSWLMSYKTYATEEEYLATSNSSSNTIYDITVSDFTDNISEWQKEQIGKYFADNRTIFGDMTVKDTVKDYSGMYYKQCKAPVDTESFPSDTAIYINYTGQLLNGLVFDTTIEKVAKDNGLYSPSKTYEPIKVNWGESFSDITMGSDQSSVISGFALTLWQMKSMEAGIGVFISDYGYGSSGSGSSIPGFSPLVFKIEIVGKPED